MRISEALELEKDVKGFVIVGKVKWVGKEKHIQGTKNGKDYDFYTIDIIVEDDTGSVYCQLPFSPENDRFQAKGQTISCISCSINEYTNKEGVLKRSIRAHDYSFEIIPDTAEPVEISPEEYEKEDTALPKKIVIEDKEPEKISYADKKDLVIIRQNSNRHATALVCKFFKAKSLEEAIAKTILASNMLTESVYTGLDYPIKTETEKTQAKLLDSMKKDSDKNVVKAEMTALQKKALDLKKEIFTLTGSDVEFASELEMFGLDVENVIDLDNEQLADFVTHIANKVLDLQKETE